MKKLLSGNEAIAYGAYLGGVEFAAAYPGTPSTEVLETISRFPGIYAEWSPNEKVALDAAVGAAYAGARALAAMKHVGLNVAADTLFYVSYTGSKAGLVIVTADDPGLYSSQNEQDNRRYAKFAKVPMLEPSDSEEAKQLTRLAFEISEQFDTPVILRSTTRISHSKTPVELESDWPPTQAIARSSTRGFERNPQKYVMIPGFARRRHPVVEERIMQLARYSDSFAFNKIEMGSSKIGVITSGISYQYAREVMPEASFLKLGMTYPLPRRLVLEFARSVDRLVVVEELDPFLEEEVKLILFDEGWGNIKVEGKKWFPMVGEFNPYIVREGLSKAGISGELGVSRDSGRQRGQVPPALRFPSRPPVLCPGCAHRGVFYALKRVRAVVFGDIGCYTLGVMPPLSALDSCGCMGASIGVLHGATKARVEDRAVAVIGDSTFFHSGIAPLVDLVYNRGVGTVIIMDNRITAMTGHQDHPGTGRTLMGEVTVAIKFEDIAQAIGVRKVFRVDPYDVEGLQALIKDCVKSKEPAVIVASHPCVLHTRERYPVPVVNPELCTNCKVCLRLGCTPIVQEQHMVRIDEMLCNGCGLCVKICPFHAIEQPGVPAGSPL